MNWKTFIVFFLVKLSAFGQLDRNESYDKIEDYILVGNLDSAKIEIKRSNIPSTSYSNLLSKLAQNSKLSSKEYLLFVERTTSRLNVDHLMLARFFKNKVPVPNSSRIDYNYVQASWHLISRLRNEAEINRSNELQNKLEIYIEKFDPKLRDVRRARVLANTHEILMKTIERDSTGILLNEKNEREALALKDTNLIILTLNNRCDFLIVLNKLDEYIEVSKFCYQLDSLRSEKSPFYYVNLTHLIDALIYRGGEDKFVLRLLDEFNSSPQRELSYSLFLKYLRYEEPDSKRARNVFNLFGVDNIGELCDTFDVQCQSILNPNDYYNLLNEARFVCYNYQEYELAMYYMDKVVQVNRETYSQDLSRSMANYQSSLVRMEEEAKLKAQIRQKKLYSLIAFLSAAFFLLLLVAFVRMRMRSKSLESKNKEIEKQRITLEKNAKEKVLLIKEIHHRVKNNFQIVSSLLDLQMKGLNESEVETILEIQGRIKSMAVVHHKLYEHEKLVISLQDYIEELIREIRIVFNQKAVEIITDVPKNIELNMDTAIPLGLIINELVTNAFKYGVHPDLSTNQITIRVVNHENHYELSVSDNGIGLPDEIDITSTKTLGLRLVRRLSHQLNGNMNYYNNQGAQFVIQIQRNGS